jgi:hypothetical protein
MSENLLLLLIISLWIGFYYFCYSQLDNYKVEAKSIIDYTSQIQLTSRTNTASAERYYREAVQELLPSPERTFWKPPSSLFIPSLTSATLPPAFHSFAQQRAAILRQDICQSASVQATINKDLFLATMNCSRAVNGILS